MHTEEFCRSLDPLNYRRTGGAIGVTRRLATYTLSAQPNGCIMVRDNWTGRDCGWGFASADAAIEAFRREDERRTCAEARA